MIISKSPSSGFRSIAIGHDRDAQDYFDRAEALGGSFEQRSDPDNVFEPYSANANKRQVSNFIEGLKDDGVWDKLTEVYLLAGVSFDGLMAKLKYDTVPTLTNNGFVEADYKPVGAAGGLKGDRSSKELATGFLDSSLAVSHKHIGSYATEESSTALANSIATGGSSGTESFYQISHGSGNRRIRFPIASADSGNTSDPSAGHLIASRISDTNVRGFYNGSEFFADSSSATAIASDNQYTLFARNGAGYSDERIAFAHIGTGLTESEALKLSNRTTELMTALGTVV